MGYYHKIINALDSEADFQIARNKAADIACGADAEIIRLKSEVEQWKARTTHIAVAFKDMQTTANKAILLLEEGHADCGNGCLSCRVQAQLRTITEPVTLDEQLLHLKSLLQESILDWMDLASSNGTPLPDDLFELIRWRRRHHQLSVVQLTRRALGLS